jgi:hypothetical protein
MGSGKILCAAAIAWLALSCAAQTKPQTADAFRKAPPSFEANQGQTDGRVKFLSRGPRYTLFLTSTESVLETRGGAKKAPAVLRVTLLGANPQTLLSGADELPGRSNYLIGNDPSRLAHGRKALLQSPLRRCVSGY